MPVYQVDQRLETSRQVPWCSQSCPYACPVSELRDTVDVVGLWAMYQRADTVVLISTAALNRNDNENTT